MVGPKTGLVYVGRYKNLVTIGARTSTLSAVQTVASHYTDYAIPAPTPFPGEFRRIAFHNCRQTIARINFDNLGHL
jgi:hypothetical protein